jgi:hypothetical protein
MPHIPTKPQLNKQWRSSFFALYANLGRSGCTSKETRVTSVMPYTEQRVSMYGKRSAQARHSTSSSVCRAAKIVVAS